MDKKSVDSVLKLCFNLFECGILHILKLLSYIELKELSEGRGFIFRFHYLCEQMCEVDWLAHSNFNFFELVFVEYVVQSLLLGNLIVARKLHCREGKLWLLHIVVYRLVKVLAHVCFKNYGEVIAKPLSLVTPLYRLSYEIYR